MVVENYIVKTLQFQSYLKSFYLCICIVFILWFVEFIYYCISSEGQVNSINTYCRTVHENLNIDELPEDEQTTKPGESDEEDEFEKYPPMPCSLDCADTAVSFCKDCSSKMCQSHMKVSLNCYQLIDRLLQVTIQCIHLSVC